ncbi:SMI1/KNR4 family protein, partial [Flavobacterium sp.]|uniref:SMI1/KNR4 family protein n=1 Tax=Flavobacterium sp. TaxID=239 RepID=UPI0026150A4A
TLIMIWQKKLKLKDHIDYLKKNNLDFDISKNEFNSNNCFFRIKILFTFRDIDAIIQINDDYEKRLPGGTFIIADADNGDYVLMNSKGNILFWNHEKNDLSFNYKVEKPLQIAKSITQFLSMLTPESNLEEEPIVIERKVSNDFHTKFKDYLK